MKFKSVFEQMKARRFIPKRDHSNDSVIEQFLSWLKVVLIILSNKMALRSIFGLQPRSACETV